ncbi:hypothetical protein [Micromonospora carbonacea]
MPVRVAVASLCGLLSDDAVRPAGWDDGDFLLRATGWFPLIG